MKKTLKSFLAICALLCVAYVFAGSAAATTSPVSYLLVQGVLTNSKVELVHSKRGGGAYVNPDGSAATFGRGTTVIFRFKNTGNQPYLPAIKVLPGPDLPPITSASDRRKLYTLAAQKVAAPGGRVDFIVTFMYRGDYRMLELLHKKAQGRPVQITVT